MILDDIVRDKRADLQTRKREVGLAALQGHPLFREARLNFMAALTTKARAIVAEVKKASPSKGVIRADFDPVWIARRYADAGAAAISVLTEERYFLGSLDYLAAIRSAVSVPLLRKDFLFDPYQLYEARAYGADAILLIVAALDYSHLAELHPLAGDLGLDALVEVHTAAELETALRLEPPLLGINNRDLHTFHTSLEVTHRLGSLVPPETLLVSESGIATPADLAAVAAAGARAVLVGESLMRQADVGAALRALQGV